MPAYDDDAHFCFLYDADLHKQEKRCGRLRPPPPPLQRRHRFTPDDYSAIGDEKVRKCSGGSTKKLSDGDIIMYS